MHPVATYFLQTFFTPETGLMIRRYLSAHEFYRFPEKENGGNFRIYFCNLSLRLYIVDSPDRELSLSKVVLFSFWE